MVRIIIAIAVVSIVLGSAAAFAVNAAAPGEPLYALDLLSEDVRSDLTTNPEGLVKVQVANAGERLLEAHKLASKDEAANVSQALDNYDEAINSVSETVGSAVIIDANSLDRVLDSAISEQDELLASLPSQDDDGEIGDEVNEGENRYCASGEPHPVALRYGEDEDDPIVNQIMTWFCGDGEEGLPRFGFGEIKHALETAAILEKSAKPGETPPTAQQLLERKADGEGWGQIWQDLELIGKNKKTGTSDEDESNNSDDAESPGQPGPPDHAGPKKQPGPPEHAGPPSHAGPKKNKDKDK